jgi:putative transposase
MLRRSRSLGCTVSRSWSTPPATCTDTKFTALFDEVFRAEGIQIVRIAAQAPRMNAIMERWVGSVRREILDRILIINAAHLRTVLAEYEDHFNICCPHRALNQASPLSPLPAPVPLGPEPRHGPGRSDRHAAGVINEYHHAA